MERFAESAGGRLLTFAVIVPLAAGAGVGWDDGRAGSIAIMVAVAVGTVLATVGGALSLETRARYTLAAIFAFPPALLLYFPLVAVAGAAPIVRAGMGLAAVGLLGWLLKGALSRAEPRAATPARRVVRLA